MSKFIYKGHEVDIYKGKVIPINALVATQDQEVPERKRATADPVPADVMAEPAESNHIQRTP